MTCETYLSYIVQNKQLTVLEDVSYIAKQYVIRIAFYSNARHILVIHYLVHIEIVFLLFCK